MLRFLSLKLPELNVICLEGWIKFHSFYNLNLIKTRRKMLHFTCEIQRKPWIFVKAHLNRGPASKFSENLTRMIQTLNPPGFETVRHKLTADPPLKRKFRRRLEFFVRIHEAATESSESWKNHKFLKLTPCEEPLLRKIIWNKQN